MHVFCSAFKPNNDGWGYSQSYSENFSSIFGKKKKKRGGYVPSWKKSAEVHKSSTEEPVSLSEPSDPPKDIKDNASSIFGKKKKKRGGYVPSWKKSAEVHESPTKEPVSLSETSDPPKDIKDAVAALAPLKEAAPELYTQAVDALRAHYEGSS